MADLTILLARTTQPVTLIIPQHFGRLASKSFFVRMAAKLSVPRSYRAALRYLVLRETTWIM